MNCVDSHIYPIPTGRSTFVSLQWLRINMDCKIIIQNNSFEPMYPSIGSFVSMSISVFLKSISLVSSTQTSPQTNGGRSGKCPLSTSYPASTLHSSQSSS